MNRVPANGIEKRPSFDVFLSYGEADRDFARPLRKRLKASRVSVWMDVFEVKGGQDWLEVTARALSESQVVVICVGPFGLGDFQKLELNLALRLEVKGALKVIPAILPGVSEADIPPLLLGFQYVDFRCVDVDPFQKLLDGVRHSLKETLASR